ncbi:MAG TPA: hypothetical protein VIL19_09200, partial [Casimicrobiaceae bacterium]
MNSTTPARPRAIEHIRNGNRHWSGKTATSADAKTWEKMLTHLMSWLESDNRGRQRLALAESLM